MNQFRTLPEFQSFFLTRSILIRWMLLLSSNPFRAPLYQEHTMCVSVFYLSPLIKSSANILAWAITVSTAFSCKSGG